MQKVGCKRKEGSEPLGKLFEDVVALLDMIGRLDGVK